MLFYGGAGILLTGVLFLVERHAPLGGFLRLAGQVGQTSLFVFVLQYFVYFFFLVLAALPYTSAWPLLFLASLLLVIRVQQAWHGRGLNRLLTVLPLLPLSVDSGLGQGPSRPTSPDLTKGSEITPRRLRAASRRSGGGRSPATR